MLNKTRTSLALFIAAASFATATVAPAVSQAATVKTKPATCTGGFKPGDEKSVTTTVVVNGKKIGTETIKSICGSDGKWHEVANLEVSNKPPRPPLGQVITVEVSEVSKVSVAGALRQGVLRPAPIG